jgi:soluble lytic murein transglycosylase-like protein
MKKAIYLGALIVILSNIANAPQKKEYNTREDKKEIEIDVPFTSNKEIVLQELSKIKPHSIINQGYINGIIIAESNGDSMATGGIGERGLMQITEDTWKDMNKNKDFDLAYHRRNNINAGIRYLNEITRMYRKEMPNWQSLSDTDKKRYVSAAYNTGFNNIKRVNYDLSKIFNSTKKYVSKTAR